MRRAVRKRRLRRDHRGVARRGLAAFVDRVQAYFFMHAHTMVASLGRLYRAPLSSAMTILVIAIALALPVSFHALLENAQRVSGELELSDQLSVFLKVSVSNEEGRKVAEKLRGLPPIAEATVLTKEDGFKELQQYSGFGEALEELGASPLPVVISIRPSGEVTVAEDMEALIAVLQAIPEADFVQVDTEWLRKLRSLLTIAQRSADILGALLGIAVLFIVGNTIRLELQHRHEELAVTKLMGAGDCFIRRPFLYTGLWYGLLGGCVACVLVVFMLLLLRGPVENLVGLYGGQLRLEFLSWGDVGRLIGFSTLLGMFGALVVVSHHLHKLAPNV